MSSIKVTQLPPCSTPLTGDEIAMLVQSGVSRQATVADIRGATQFGGEETIAPGAATVNNVVLTEQRVLVNTAFGPITVTGFVAAEDGSLVVATNIGPNDLTLAYENVGSTAANRLYGVTDVTLPPRASIIIQYSATLSRWVMV